MFSNIIYGLDIETSTIDSMVYDDKKISYMISYCISKINILNGEYEKVEVGRTYDDLDRFLYKLNDYANDNEKEYLIYIHNFDYEYSFFKNNLKYFKEMYNEDDDTSYLFMSMNSPLYIELGRLIFRCSLKLLSKSIAQLGNELKIPKLDYEYTKVRTPLTILSQQEIDYNYRDVEIMLKAIYKLYTNNQYINSVKDIPLTKTGISRLNCEKNKEVNKTIKLEKKQYNSKGKSKGKRQRKIYDFHIKKCQDDKAKTEEQLRKWEQCFQGGLVFSNPKYCGVVIDKVASIDFSSSYPTQILYRYFPYDFKIIKENKLDTIKKYIRQEFNDYTQLILPKPFYTYFNCTVTIKNVKAKYFFYPLSIAKIENFNELYNDINCKFLNGKIINSEIGITITVSSLDLFIISLFYDFEIEDCSYLESTRKTKKSTEYMINACVYNGMKKVEYKVYNNLIQDNLKYKQYSNKEIKDDYFRESVNTKKDYIEQKEIAHSLLLSVKSDLNALYGINAMHLLHDRWRYNIDEMDWINNPDSFEYYLNKRCKSSYIYGMYVACYARSSLCYAIYKLLNNDIEIYYSDTDSVKYKDDIKADKIIIEFNRLINKMLGDEYKELKFGTLDKEHVYNKFVTIGTKSYITLMDNNIDATISGVPNATRIFQRLYEENYNYNFNDLIFECYHYDCTIDKSCIKKLAHTYGNVKEHIKVYDKTVNKLYEETVISGCVLSDTSVQMKSFESKLWRSYGRIIRSTFYDTVNSLTFDIHTDIKLVNDKFIVTTKINREEIL